MAGKKDKDINLEQALGELESLVEEMESGDLPLEDLEAWRDERLQALLSLLRPEREAIATESRAAPGSSDGR